MTGARVRLGELLDDRYRLDAVAGRGGVGVVYQATDLRTGEPVQATVLYARIRDVLDADAVAPMLAATADLTGAGPGAEGLAVPLAASAAPVAHVVTAPVAGRSLAGRLAEGSLPERQAAALGARLAGALGLLHDRGLVHRFVRPSAIALREQDGAPILLDVGLGRIVRPAYFSVYEKLVGTAAYVSPEQVWNEPVGPGTDLYGLALVLIEALTGAPAFPGTTASDAVARTLTRPRVPEHLDPAFADLLARMTAFRPEDRPGAAEAASALHGLASPPVPAVPPSPTVVLPAALLPAALPTTAPLPATTLLQATPARRPRRRSRLLVLAGIAALACALTAGGSGTPHRATSAARIIAAPAARSAVLNAEHAVPAPTAPQATPRPRRVPAPRPTPHHVGIAVVQPAPAAPAAPARSRPASTPKPVPTRSARPAGTTAPTRVPSPIRTPSPDPAPTETPAPTPTVTPAVPAVAVPAVAASPAVAVPAVAASPAPSTAAR